MSTSIYSRISPGKHPLIFSLAIAAFFVAFSCVFFNPRWDTNDDVAMSMMAHGYGIAAYGSPCLIFSNVLWGFIVRGLPSVGGLLGYSIATLLALTLAGASILYFLLRAGSGYVVGLLVLTLILTRPVMFPQFTTTAGLLTVAALLSVDSLGRGPSTSSLIAACCLGFTAYLIRAPEFLLVCGVAIPLLPWRSLFRSRATAIAVASVGICMAGAALVDIVAYSGPSWEAFRQLNWTRAQFTDFSAVDYILRHPDIMQRHGLSANDVRLIGDWFFVDRKIADPAVLKAMLAEIPAATEVSAAAGIRSFMLIFDPRLLALTLTGLLLLAVWVTPGRLIAWVMCVTAIFCLGALGRADVVRVYIPLLTLLIVIPCATPLLQLRWKFHLVVGGLLAGTLLNVWQLTYEAKASNAVQRQARLAGFSSQQSTVVWGASLPFEYLFPVLTRRDVLRDTRIYSLGVSTLAPSSVASEDEREGNGLLVRLRSSAGLPLIASDRLLSLLRTYCAERYGSMLKLSEVRKTELWTVMNASCPPIEGIQ